MSEDLPPSRVSEAPAPTSPAAEAPAPPPRGRVGDTVATAVRRVGRWLYVALNLPKGPWPVPTATSLFVISLIVVAAVELLPRILVAIFVDVTSTVRARTEVLTVELQLDPTYRWWLPRGKYALITAASAVGCEHRSRLDLACDYAQATSVTIKNGASVRFEITTVPGAKEPSFMLALTPRADNPEGRKSSFEIRDSADKVLVETSDLVTFASQPVEQWRIPLARGARADRRVVVGQRRRRGRLGRRRGNRS